MQAITVPKLPSSFLNVRFDPLSATPQQDIFLSRIRQLHQCKTQIMVRGKANSSTQNYIYGTTESAVRQAASLSVSVEIEASVTVHHGSSGGGDGGGGKRRFPPFGGGGGGGRGAGDNQEDDSVEEEARRALTYVDYMRMKKGAASLPADKLEAAKPSVIHSLLEYWNLQEQVRRLLPLFCATIFGMLLPDPSFLHKITKGGIDSCRAIYMEVQKRWKDLSTKFPLHRDRLFAISFGIAVLALSGFFGQRKHACGALPSSVFEAGSSGCKFSVKQQIAENFIKVIVYGSAGFGCYLFGQGIANLIMTAKSYTCIYMFSQGIVNLIMTVKRSMKKPEEDTLVLPPVKSAPVQGDFIAAAPFNTSGQLINGLQRRVEASPSAVAPFTMDCIVGRRFRNIYIGMQIVTGSNGKPRVILFVEPASD